MSQLRYHQRAYFRTSQTDAESFHPYALSILSICLVTFLLYGLQNTLITSSSISGSTIAAVKLRCTDFAGALKLANCDKEKISNADVPSGDSYTLEQDLHNFTN